MIRPWRHHRPTLNPWCDGAWCTSPTGEARYLDCPGPASRPAAGISLLLCEHCYGFTARNLSGGPSLPWSEARREPLSLESRS